MRIAYITFVCAFGRTDLLAVYTRLTGGMSGEGADEFVVFDNCMELVTDTSVLELTTDPKHATPLTTVPAARPSPCPADGDVHGHSVNINFYSNFVHYRSHNLSVRFVSTLFP